MPSSSASAMAAPRSSACSRPARPSTRRPPARSRWPTPISATEAGPALRRLSAGRVRRLGLFVGVPVVIGAGGVERIVEIELNADERAAFARSADAVRELCAAVECSAASDLGRPQHQRAGPGMNIHEYQAKALLASTASPFPRGQVAYTPARPRRWRASSAARSGGQGADPRRRPRQGRRRQARQVARGGAPGRRPRCSA